MTLPAALHVADARKQFFACNLTGSTRVTPRVQRQAGRRYSGLPRGLRRGAPGESPRVSARELWHTYGGVTATGLRASDFPCRMGSPRTHPVKPCETAAWLVAFCSLSAHTRYDVMQL